LDNSDYEDFHGGGGFSHVYIIMQNAKNEYISFYIQFNMFPCMKISSTFFWHLGPKILSLMNRKNQPNGEKKESFCL
jgi:hypothetical protein